MTRTRIYLDNSASTPVRDEVREAMQPYFTESFGNPSSLYELGQRSKAAVERAREQLAASIGARPEEIVFTGGGTESDNACLVGIAEALADKGRHLVTTEFEHHAVLEPMEYLAERGWEVTFVRPPKNGVLTADQIAKAMRPDTVLVSVIMVNNEIGTIQPVAPIAEVVKARGAILHSDAVQALGKVPVDVRENAADLLSFSAHKLYGPKGVGATYIRQGTPMQPFLRGGGQERGLRSGTHNVPGIVGFGLAAELAVAELDEEMVRLTELREHVLDVLFERIPEMYLNGDRQRRSPGNINLIIRGVEGEAMLMMLDQEGLAVSVGSACSSGSPKPSHVIASLGVPEEDAHGSLRVALGRYTIPAHVDRLVDVLPCVVERLREMSPYWRQIVAG